MDFDTLVSEISNARRVPVDALRAITPYAGRLKPRIIALTDKYLKDGWLFPEEAGLLFYGLFMMAADRAHDFWPSWLELLKADYLLQDLFGDGHITTVRNLSLGLGGDAAQADSVAELILGDAISIETRDGLMEALARWMCEGKYPRAGFVALIDALAKRDFPDEDGTGRWCIAGAIVDGGIAERRGLLEQLWASPDFDTYTQADRADCLATLEHAAAHPADMTRFDECGAHPPKDALDGLRWLVSMQNFDETPEMDCLSWQERHWLDALLTGPDVPPGSMNFEELDGFFHALAIIPEMVMPSEYLREIWRDGPVFEDMEHLKKALGLLHRHWNAITTRVHTDEPPEFWMEPQKDQPPGAIWARGFSRGAGMRPSSLTMLAVDEEAITVFECITVLARDEMQLWERIECLQQLGDNWQFLQEHWREHGSAASEFSPSYYAPPEPVRSQKVGRNEPCPCGSGKKWKKCCGAGPNIVH